MVLLARMFRRNGRAIVIARSSSFLSLSSASCNNFNEALYSKCIKFGILVLAHQDKMQLEYKRHNSESYSFGVMPLLT